MFNDSNSVSGEARNTSKNSGMCKLSAMCSTVDKAGSRFSRSNSDKYETDKPAKVANWLCDKFC